MVRPLSVLLVAACLTADGQTRPDFQITPEVPAMPRALMKFPRTPISRAKYPAIDFHLHGAQLRTADDYQKLIKVNSYNQSELASKALMNRDARHPLGAWYHVASVYDGKEFSNYVDGVREGAAELQLALHGPGRASVGARINKVFYVKGAVRLARFTRRALSPAEFLEPPAKR